MNARQAIIACAAGGLIFSLCNWAAAADVLVPRIDGDFWTVSGDPDLGKWTDPKQQPVDFGVWQAKDGTWQLWSCIRKTKCGGNTRLFYGWEGKRITDKDWKPAGIKMTADKKYGEAIGGLQAPHVIPIDGVFQMFYGDWRNICLTTGRDGKKFTRVLDKEGRPQLFGDKSESNTRDAMVLPIGDTYYCYYTAHPNGEGAVYCRTSKDLKTWSDPTKVAYGGQAGTHASTAECPFVVFRHGWYYLFRTQRYGRKMQTSVYRSKDPLNFGVEDDRFFVCRLPVAAPEIIHHEGQDYIATLKRSLKGIEIARLQWVADEPVLIPTIDGQPWSVTDNPDLGKWTNPKQQPVDFGVWQAKDGTWQLWSCIRNTKCGGNTRLFYGWEGKRVTDKNWKPAGIKMTADEKYGEAAGGLQAPHVILVDGVYQMFYGNWNGICLTTGRDGKCFRRVLDPRGSSQLFTEAEGVHSHARDPMLLRVGDKYHCYYTGHVDGKGYDLCRTSKDLKRWSKSTKVLHGFRSGGHPYSVECPFVVHRNGWYYLFATQRYGKKMVTHVYCSRDPMDFGRKDDSRYVCSLPVAAPEVVRHEGQDYLFWLKGSLQGIEAARLKWVPKPAEARQ